jgi:hypothetical protein
MDRLALGLLSAGPPVVHQPPGHGTIAQAAVGRDRPALVHLTEHGLRDLALVQPQGRNFDRGRREDGVVRGQHRDHNHDFMLHVA